MRRVLTALCACLLVCSPLAGCDRGDVGATATPDLPEVPDPIEKVPSESIVYRCEGGYEVVVSGDTALVAAPDGRGISLPRSAGQHAMEFTGNSMAFSVAADDAVLTRDEGGRYTCKDVD